MADSDTSKGNGSELSSDAREPTPKIVSTASFDNSLSLQITSFRLNGRNFL